MMMSVDGRIDCPMVALISGEEYYDALDLLGKSSKLSGRVTAALECSAVGTTGEANERVDPLASKNADSDVTDIRHLETKSVSLNAHPSKPIGHEAVNIACKSDEYTIVTDTRGSLDWISGEADGHPLLCLMSGQVSDEHLKTMLGLGISYIVTGKERIDLERAMELAYSEFGIEKVVVVGGGHINGGFLEAGLLDEVSVMVAAGIDGRKGETAIFDGAKWQGNKPYSLRLKDVRQWEGTETIWIRYEVVR